MTSGMRPLLVVFLWATVYFKLAGGAVFSNLLCTFEFVHVGGIGIQLWGLDPAILALWMEPS